MFHNESVQSVEVSTMTDDTGDDHSNICSMQSHTTAIIMIIFPPFILLSMRRHKVLHCGYFVDVVISNLDREL